MLNPVTHEVMEPIFCKELIRQELDDSTPYFDIPEEVQAYYRTCRPSPLVRAYRLEKLLGTPAKIYYKSEGNNTSGSHKLNSAAAQACYAKKQGLKGVTAETGTGYFDLTASQQFNDGTMTDTIPTDADLEKGFESNPKLPGNTL